MGLINRCKHVRVRCIHGDEILARRGRRVACWGCGKTFKGMERFHEDGCNWMEYFGFVMEKRNGS